MAGLFTYVAFAGAEVDNPRKRRSWPAVGCDPIADYRDGDKTSAGVEVTPESALRLPSAFSPVNVLATDLAALPIKLYQGLAGAGRRRILDDPRVELVSVSPDGGDTTAFDWRRDLLGYACTRGNGHAEIVFDGGGRAAAMFLMDPRSTRAHRNRQDGRKYYTHSRGRLPAYRVLHIRGIGFDGMNGYAPYDLAAESIGLGLGAQDYAASWFGQSSEPEGFFRHPGIMDEEAQARFRKDWDGRHKGVGKRHGYGIVEEGLEWVPTSPDPEKSQLTAVRAFQRVELAAVLRLPPHKVGDYAEAHLANIEAANLDYVTTVLMPWCVCIEQQLNLRLLTREERLAGYYFQHDMRAFMRGDSKARAEYLSKLVGGGIAVPDEARDLEDWNPHALGDPARPGSYAFIQGAMVPLERAIAGGDDRVGVEGGVDG